MSWISGNCQDNKHYSCTYMNFDGVQWCRDSDDPCYGSDDGGALWSVQDNWAKSGGW
jgi:hypothetical protein